MSLDDQMLEEALEIASQIETATKLMSKLACRFSPQPTLATQHVEAPKRPPGPAPSDTDPGVNYTARARNQPCRSSGNCGSSSHVNRAPTCPVRGQIC